MGLYVAFSDISAISRRPVSLMEEAGVPGENHRPAASNWQTLSHISASQTHPVIFANAPSEIRTHPVVVKGYSDLQVDVLPTT